MGVNKNHAGQVRLITLVPDFIERLIRNDDQNGITLDFMKGGEREQRKSRTIACGSGNQ